MLRPGTSGGVRGVPGASSTRTEGKGAGVQQEFGRALDAVCIRHALEKHPDAHAAQGKAYQRTVDAGVLMGGRDAFW